MIIYKSEQLFFYTRRRTQGALGQSASPPSLVRQLIPYTISWHKKDKKVTRSGFSKGKAWLNFCDEVTALVSEGRAVDIA